MAKPELALRVAAKAVIEVEDSILVLHPSEINQNDAWYLPGGIREDLTENILDTVVRKVRRETGIELSSMTARVLTVAEWNAMDKRERVKILAVFFHFRLPLIPTIVLSPEHDDSRWVRRNTYREVRASREVCEMVESLL